MNRDPLVATPNEVVLYNSGTTYRRRLVSPSGDHSIFVGEVQDAGVKAQPAGRPDDVTLTLKDLGDKVFYGG